MKSSIKTDINKSVRNLTLIVAAIAILIGAGLAWRITVSITHPMDEAVEVAQSVVEGLDRLR